MPGFQSFFRVFASFCIGQISHQHHIRVNIVVWNLDNFDPNLEIKNNFTIYLKKSWRCSEQYFFSEYFPDFAGFTENTRLLLAAVRIKWLDYQVFCITQCKMHKIQQKLVLVGDFIKENSK